MIKNNYITHLVEDRDRLVEILREGFVPNYHKEDLSPSEDHNDKFVVGIPMTSFADVPIEELSFMMKEYGRYGIVMSKLWALQSENLSPVHYISDMTYLHSVISGITSDSIPFDFIRYTKKYISDWNGKPYLNYQEREWRHALPDRIAEWFKSEKDYNDWRYRSRKRPTPNDNLKRNALTFDVKDIVSIILKDEKDMRLFLQKISCLDDFSGNQRKLTTTEMAYLESICVYTD